MEAEFNLTPEDLLAFRRYHSEQAAAGSPEGLPDDVAISPDGQGLLIAGAYELILRRWPKGGRRP